MPDTSITSFINLVQKKFSAALRNHEASLTEDSVQGVINTTDAEDLLNQAIGATALQIIDQELFKDGKVISASAEAGNTNS